MGREFSGDLMETDEALPFWCPLSEIPWDKMWEDDIHWLPQAIEGKRFSGKFVFDGENMIDREIEFFS